MELKAKSNMLVWSVKDRGIGIPENIMENLFEPDQVSSRKGTEGEKGTGFGMPILKKFVEAHGGTVDVESKDIASYPEEHGTVIRVGVPKAA